MEFKAPNKLEPIQSIETENVVLGSLLFDQNSISKVADILSENDFYLAANKVIYRGIKELYFSSKLVDLMNLNNWLTGNNLLDKIGGNQRIVDLLDQTVTSANIEAYARILIEKRVRRDLAIAAKKIEDLAFEQSEDLEVTLDKAEKTIFDVTQVQLNQNNLKPIPEIALEVFQELQELQNNTKQVGLTTGFKDFDAITGGLHRGDLSIIAARPSAGKTSFATNLAVNIAKLHELPVAIFSLEMSKKQLVQRILSAESQVDSNRLKDGIINDLEVDAVTEAFGVVSELNIFINDDANPTVNQIRSEVRRLQSEKGALGMVMIDYLQLMGGTSDNRNLELGKITRSLKQLAKEVDVPIVVLSQLSRGVESRQNKRPIMSDLRESGSIEQDADIILMLYRDEYYDPEDSPDKGMAELIIAKHRNGGLGNIKLVFRKEFTRFLNL